MPDWAEEPGLSQVSCECGNDTFYFLLSTTNARLLCSVCKKVVSTMARTPPN